MSFLKDSGAAVSQAFDPGVVPALCWAADRSRAVAPGRIEDRREMPMAGDDPAELCASVRSLASRSYQVLCQAAGTSVTSIRDVSELLERVARCERQIDEFRRLHRLPLGDLRGWISGLRRRIESLQVRPS